ncbi:MAG: hypothetical protein S4CHLAM20_02410 [Chlamydiia bacterium]|nr:hypothetical protein [Chlamydiia bacterium]
MEVCPLCILQRFFMCGVGVFLLFNIKGPYSFKNLAGSLLSCVLGSIVALYQWSQLLINDGVSHAPKILSLPMYVWSAILFFAVALTLFFMMFFMKREEKIKANLFVKVAFGAFTIILITQIFSAFYSCGLFLC